MNPFLGKSQITNQCPPDSQLKKLLNDARQRPVLQERIALLNDDINLLNKRIIEKQSIIDDYRDKDTAHIRIVGTYEKEIAVMEEQKKTYQAEIDRLNSELKKEKRKRFWSSVGGVAGIGIMAYLYITK